MKGILSLCCLLAGMVCYSGSSAGDTLRLSREQCEGIFLKENLSLIAERLNMDRARALRLQASLWPNPTFSLDQVNFWATPGQLQGMDGIPPLWGKFGRNQEFCSELEQMVLTAGKRKKLVAIEQVSVDMAGEYFEELLRGLKIEFRKSLTELQYLQQYREIYTDQVTSLQTLVRAYSNQMEKGNIGQGEYIRLKALLMEISKEINEVSRKINRARSELGSLMRLEPTMVLVLNEEGFVPDLDAIRALSLDDMLDRARENRPDLKIALLEEDYHKRVWEYEKARKIPDLTLRAAYDRGGNAMLNFIGFGFAMDLPFFNRNQGNIEYARIGIEQSKILSERKRLGIQNSVALSYQNLFASLAFFETIEPGYETSLERLLGSYTRNFASRNIGMLEYIDFLNAYLDNKKMIIGSGREVGDHLEELRYEIGDDIF